MVSVRFLVPFTRLTVTRAVMTSSHRDTPEVVLRSIALAPSILANGRGSVAARDRVVMPPRAGIPSVKSVAMTAGARVRARQGTLPMYTGGSRTSRDLIAIAEPLKQVQLRHETIQHEEPAPAPAPIDAMGAAETPESDDTRTAVTDCLKEWRDGDELARDRLFDLVYEYLRVQARRALRHERGEHTLGTTDLVHEAYLRLVAPAAGEWRDRTHFFATAARAMRRILVDHARKRGAQKRGAAGERVPLVEDLVAADQRADHVVELDEALTRLGAVDARLASVVEYRYFAGLSEEETAELMGVTARTVRRDWVKARGWLYRELGLGETGPSESE